MEIFRQINNANPHIKFEIEHENAKKSINYLDFTIINNRFDTETKWYQKHIASGRFLNYHSHHTRTTIWNTAIAFVFTMIKNSDASYIEEITTKARHLLHINSYPNNYSNRIIEKAKEKATTSTQLDKQTQQAAYVQGLPHIPHLSQNIQSDIEESYSNSNKNKIKTANIPIHKMSQ